mmetsp:Transcript_34137/g.77324  ORF Transcript_34137/g.77324 Transcript_34137/m.77324 type:complete len:225 (-) Transcript_34137:49-723(-)
MQVNRPGAPWTSLRPLAMVAAWPWAHPRCAVLAATVLVAAQAVRDGDSQVEHSREADAEEVRKRCTFSKSSEPKEALRQLQDCTVAVQALSATTQREQSASRAANVKYAHQFKDVMNNLAKFQDLARMRDAFSEDQKTAQTFLLRQVDLITKEAKDAEAEEVQELASRDEVVNPMSDHQSDDDDLAASIAGPSGSSQEVRAERVALRAEEDEAAAEQLRGLPWG